MGRCHCLYLAPSYANNTETYFYREGKENDELTLKVEFFQRLNPDAIINLFVSKEPVSQCISENQNIIRFSNMLKFGDTTSQNDYYYDLNFNRDVLNNYPWMKLKRQEEQFCCQLSSDGVIWED